MDEGLFLKHIRKLKEVLSDKQEVITCIQEATGITLQESEITLSKKEVGIHTSSVKRNSLIQKNYIQVLKEKGFTVK